MGISIPRGVEMAGLENIEAKLDTLDVGVAVLAGDAVEFGLESDAVGLFLIERKFSSMGVANKVAHIQFDVLSGAFLLVGLEPQEPAPPPAPAAPREEVIFLTTNQIFDGLRERNLVDPLLQLL